jgi:hypothetical protein
MSVSGVFTKDFLLFECLFCDDLNGVVDVLPVLVESFEFSVLIWMLGDLFCDGTLPLASFVR